MTTTQKDKNWVVTFRGFNSEEIRTVAVRKPTHQQARKLVEQNEHGCKIIRVARYWI